MSENVNLTASFVPLAGEHDRVKLALEIAIEQVLAEPGCERYEITEDTEDRILLTERWSSQADLDRHSKGVAVQDLNESLSALLAEPVALNYQ